MRQEVHVVDHRCRRYHSRNHTSADYRHHHQKVTFSVCYVCTYEYQPRTGLFVASLGSFGFVLRVHTALCRSRLVEGLK